MNKALLQSMTEAEHLLVAETERDALAVLSEDELLELHKRVRRARNKYVKNYRRSASAAISARGGRGFSYTKNQRDRAKAEIFELALARVSRQVARVAKQAAADLKAERLAAARNTGKRPAGDRKPGRGGGSGTPAGRRPAAVKSTGGIKKDASSRAQGARRQAARDAR